MNNSIRSIPQLLDYFRNTNQYLFYIGPIYGTTALIINDYMPTFEMLTCNDPYFGTFPFIKVPESFKKNHTKCILGAHCQNQILSDPEVIAYMKSKDPNPKVLFMLIDKQTQQICKANGLTIWGPTRSQLYQYLGNKVKIIELLQKSKIPYIPNILSKINSFEHLRQITTHFNTSKLVIQDQNGVGGFGTTMIENQNDYNLNKKHLENGEEFRIMPFKRVKPVTIDAICMKKGTVVSPIFADIIGHPQLTPFWAGYCGDEFRKSYFEDSAAEKKIREQAFEYTRIFGDFLYRQGLFKGFFGIDYLVDLDTYEIYFSQINPRVTGKTSLEFELYQSQGHKFPIFLFHILEYLEVDLNIDINILNEEWIQLDHYENQFSFLVLRPLSPEQQNIPYNFPAGFWRFRDGQLEFTGKIDFHIDNLKEDEIFFTPNRGFSKGNITIRGRVRAYDWNLTEKAKNIIQKFVSLRVKSIKA